MLTQLEIQNFTIIDHLQVDFHAGFSVITGETGAGKSIILGALSLLLGNRADLKNLRTAGKKCVIEGHFDISDYHFETFFEENGIDYDAQDSIFRREIAPNGKSRGFINDTPVSLNLMHQLGEQLIDIHSQHQNLLLQQENFQLNTLDIMALNGNLLQSYGQAYQAWQAAEKQLLDEKQRIETAKQNEDYLRFLLNELDEASIAEDELEQLEQESELLSHAEEIKKALYAADNLLSNDTGIVSQTKQATQEISSIAHVYSPITELAERLDSAHIELKDILQEIDSHLNNIDFDPQRLDNVQERLELLHNLMKKHKAESLSQLLSIQESLRNQIQQIDNNDQILSALQENVENCKTQAKKLARDLTAKRKEAALKIEKSIQAQLVQLGIPHVQFRIDIDEKPLSRDGADKTAFMFSANKNIPLQPISQVASGGEIARVMLCLKALISQAKRLPTIIFDEIDTGVSGSIAEKMARIMKDMGNHDRQVIAITHLPQIAAMGTHHYKVSKEDTPEGTTSRMTELNPEQRISEIAQMLSGSDISQAAIENAKNLLHI